MRVEAAVGTQGRPEEEQQQGRCPRPKSPISGSPLGVSVN